MSTSSFIGIKNADDSVTSIYCHHDGYPEYNGKILINYYNDENKVRELINLGDISSLKKKVAPEPGSIHSFDTPDEDVTIAYMRDRGEKSLPVIHLNMSNYIDAASDNWVEYAYIFDEGKWWVAKLPFVEWELVEDVLEG